MKKPYDVDNEDQDDSGSEGEGGQSGRGGASGSVEFHWDFADSRRDDQLSPEEKRQALLEHEARNGGHVKDGLLKKEDYKRLKEGKVATANYAQGFGQGMGQGYANEFNKHFLSDTNQWGNGMRDSEMGTTPSEGIVATNADARSEVERDLANELRLGQRLTAAPRSAPTLVRK